MMINALKKGFGLALVMAVLVGCASKDTVDETADYERDGVRTGTTDRDGVRAGVDDDRAALENVVYFDFDQAVLKPETRAILLAHADRLKANPRQVRLEGHTDERGTREYNMALGERRANAVRDFLVLQGVSRNSLEVISYGEERPVAHGSNESAWAQNRRVEIRY